MSIFAGDREISLQPAQEYADTTITQRDCQRPWICGGDVFENFIIVDALDECQRTDNCLPAFLTEVFSLQAKTGANFFATSRRIPDIEARFGRYLKRDVLASYDDVICYLHSHILELRPFVQKAPGLQEKIWTEIAASVEGMYVEC